MSDNGTQPETTTADAEVQAEQVIPQRDLGELLEGAVRKAVTAQINAQAKQIAEGVVLAMLTDEVIAGMRETAIVEAELALNPALDLDPEPEPEPVAEVPAEPQEEAEPEPPKMQYPTVKEFVEEYLVVLYRREVSVRNAPLHWCPKWWVHGEVVARFEALHQAFEHLRQGEETELAAWWLVYLDQMMDRVFDKEGPFKYCSVAEGHSAKMRALPVTIAPPEAFVQSDQGAASTLVLPDAPIGHSRTVMTIEDTGEVDWPEIFG